MFLRSIMGKPSIDETGKNKSQVPVKIFDNAANNSFESIESSNSQPHINHNTNEKAFRNRLDYQNMDMVNNIRKHFLNYKQANLNPQSSDFKAQQFQRKLLRQYLDLRYPRLITEKILDYFEFTNIVTVPELVDKFNVLINSTREEKLDFCFQLFDTNDDEIICMKDLMDLTKLLNENDYFIQQDLNTLMKFITQNAKLDEVFPSLDKYQQRLTKLGIYTQKTVYKKLKITHII